MSNRLLHIFCVIILFIDPIHIAAQIKTPDFNNDGKIDFQDFLLFARAFGSNNPADLATFDITNTGTVGFSDFLQLASRFGETISQSFSVGNITIIPSYEDTVYTALINNVAKIFGDDGGIIHIAITNTNTISAQLKVESGIETYTSFATKTVIIPASATDTVKLTPLISDSQLQLLNENKTVNYRTRVSLIRNNTTEEFYHETYTAQMLAKDVFDFRYTEIIPFIATWITPHIFAIEELISKAVNHNPKNSFVGYQGSPTKDGYRKETISLIDSVDVPAGQIYTITATFSEYDFKGTISGSLVATGGVGDDIKISIHDGNVYQYQSGLVHTANFTTDTLNPGTSYQIEIDNTAAFLFTRKVVFSFTISYTEDIIYPQVKAIYNALKNDYSVTYVNSLISYPSGTQRVRYPNDALTLGSANCIDGAVLFASALENIGLEPLICFYPGHAFVGWRRWTGSNVAEFLETTMIGNANYEDAFNEGGRQFNEYKALNQLLIVDVTEYRGYGITPGMKRIVNQLESADQRP